MLSRQVTLWSTLVVAAGLYYGKALGLSNNVTPLLAVVVGLLLVFRNSTAYTRWDEGRKAFGNLVSPLAQTVGIILMKP
jgi:putative membrane protein